MDFEWDEGKAARNLAKHGISFDTATVVFLDDRRAVELDGRFDYAEQRYKVIGRSRGQVLDVIFTNRGSAVRIISARTANRDERKRYGHR